MFVASREFGCNKEEMLLLLFDDSGFLCLMFPEVFRGHRRLRRKSEGDFARERHICCTCFKLLRLFLIVSNGKDVLQAIGDCAASTINHNCIFKNA